MEKVNIEKSPVINFEKQTKRFHESIPLFKRKTSLKLTELKISTSKGLSLGT
jgi:hypothetical protein